MSETRLCRTPCLILRCTADFSQQLSEFDSRSGLPPSSLCWCGVDAVALRWDSLLLLVGPYGDWLKRPCEGPVVLVPEVDGLRLLTATTMSLLRRVPDVLIQVRVGPVIPGWAACGAALWRTTGHILRFRLPKACCGGQHDGSCSDNSLRPQVHAHCTENYC